MLTLQELKSGIAIPKSSMRVPTARELKESGRVIADKKLSVDAEICVYENGYAIYQVCRRSTVFSVHSCGEYLYVCDGNIIHLPVNFFEKEKWYLRLVLEGEDRLNRNQKERERSISYSDVSEEWAVMEELAESALEQLVKRETVEEMLQLLTDKQKTVIQKYYMQGKTQMQISEELGVSRIAVRDLIIHAVSKIRKRYCLECCQSDYGAGHREER